MPAGVVAPGAPRQVDIAHGAQLRRGDVTLVTRAHVDITARVLAREHYAHDDGASLAPEDLALGWGRMSDSAVLAHIEISQSRRFYYWRAANYPIPRREIETSSANMHMIPADDDVRRQLQQLRTGQLVHIEGFLVDARRPDGWRWKTSLSRNDIGASACELVFVERLDTETP